ncbi:MAG TPA: NRDE family protein [Myxococcales bacterium]|nr:NRDE family protein [Myxococcales bacterium]
MCTLVLLLQPGELLAASGNRNELLARPASGPRIHDGILAPRDEAAHGTWLGLNRHGLFVCVTNRHGAMLDLNRRSRGLLVRDALQAPSARALHEQLKTLPGELHNGFHLVYADLRDAFVTWGDGHRITQLRLSPDELHVVTERSFGAGEGARERDAYEAFKGLPFEAEAWRVPMTTHAALPLESACVHADALGYGTRSSLQLMLRPRSARLLWTDGHPCVNAPRDLSAEATSLFS